VDSFAYLHFNRRSDGSLQLPDGWQITAVTADDLLELKGFYAQVSGGLMLDALDLTPEKAGCDTLSREYRKLGLTRERQLYAVKKNGQLAAIFLVIISDVGLNLSDITNCIKVFTTGCAQLDADILRAAVFQVAQRCDALLSLYLGGMGEGAGKPAQAHADGGQRLPGLVVQMR